MANAYNQFSNPLFAVDSIDKIYQTRIRIERIRSQLETERSSFEGQWRENNDFVAPRRARFFADDVNRGDRRNRKILDSTPVVASRTLAAGMVAGITSPSRPWFRLGLPRTRNQQGNINVRDTESDIWLNTVTEIMADTFARTNLYRVLPTIYRDMAVFGTGCLYVEEDVNNVVRFQSFPIGSYSIAQGPDLRANTFIREFQLTANQIVDKFGRNPEKPMEIDWTNISETARALYESQSGETWLTMIHAIVPNHDYRPERIESKHKKYLSVYYELGRQGRALGGRLDSNTGADRYKLLSEKGYDMFPVLCPRWEITGEDVYGTDCPAITAIGDIKQLQTSERRSLQALEKQVFPNMKAPAALKGQGKSHNQPGDITYIPGNMPADSYAPAYQVNFSNADLEAKQAQVRERILNAFYIPQIIGLSTTDRKQITAREVEERSAEKLLVFGPVLEQLNQDLLDPLIDITFDKLLQAGKIPPPPENIAGQEIKVEYISVMAQAQKLVAAGNIEQFTQFMGGLAQIKPEALDKMGTDVLVDTYGDITSVPPDAILDEDAVAEIRDQRAQQQQAIEESEAASVDAQTLKALSETRVDEANALTEGAL